MKYLVKRISSQAREIIECTGCTPSAELFDDILNCPVEVEHPNDCDIVEEIEPMFGQLVRKVVFNETKRAARWAQELADKWNAEAQAQAEKEARQAIRQGFQDVIAAIDLIDHTTIADANTKKVCGDLKRALKDLARFSKDATIRTLTV